MTAVMSEERHYGIKTLFSSGRSPVATTAVQ